LINWVEVTGGPNGILGVPAPVICGYAFNTLYKMYYLSWAFVVFCASRCGMLLFLEEIEKGGG
jgi:ABC-type branched-subunit amino acid transport system permease subunit